MNALDELTVRRTSADIVFSALYDEIVGLSMLPGEKMSEADIAKRFGLSRQPVREAFSRLSKLGLVSVRPQRSTLVRHFSLTGIQNARFIRTAVELEVLRKACRDRDVAFDARLQDNIAAQRRAVDTDDTASFHTLDYEFHRLLCCAAGSEFAFETISSNKAQVDRLCMLSLTTRAAMEDLYADHIDILEGLQSGAAAQVETAIRRHLDRLSPTIEKIYQSHRDYFE